MSRDIENEIEMQFDNYRDNIVDLETRELVLENPRKSQRTPYLQTPGRVNPAQLADGGSGAS